VGNASYHPVQNCFLHLSNTIKIEIYKNYILHLVLYGCENQYLTLKDEQCLNVF
jgi:hypothetical protein